MKKRQSEKRRTQKTRIKRKSYKMDTKPTKTAVNVTSRDSVSNNPDFFNMDKSLMLA